MMQEKVNKSARNPQNICLEMFYLFELLLKAPPNNFPHQKTSICTQYYLQKVTFKVIYIAYTYLFVAGVSGNNKATNVVISGDYEEVSGKTSNVYDTATCSDDPHVYAGLMKDQMCYQNPAELTVHINFIFAQI